MKIDNKEGLRHLLLEGLLLILLSLTGWLIAQSHDSFSTRVSIAGYLSFGVFEYCVHRYVFHFKAKKNWLKPFVYKIHGIHHSYPEEQEFYKTSPYAKAFSALLVGLVIFFIFSFASLNFSAGFTLGYLQYLSVHFAIHHFWPPKGVFGLLWKNHHIHHYINSKVAYGISNPIWDLVFFSFPKRKDYKKLPQMKPRLA